MENGIVDVDLVDLRPFGVGRHHVTDDYPFGGGPGMVMKPEPLFAAVESLRLSPEVPIILLSPQGRKLDQSVAEEMAGNRRMVLITGQYEGVDDRVRSHLTNDEISIGDYVLSCGELAAMVVTDAVSRLLPGALADSSTTDESFSDGLLEYPQYTRPADFRGWPVPDVLVSGHHANIQAWRRAQSLRRTFEQRPELLESASLSPAERDLVARWTEGVDPDSA
jgi:tRNA (guanine37-N1)-methyltransferase